MYDFSVNGEDFSAVRSVDTHNGWSLFHKNSGGRISNNGVTSFYEIYDAKIAAIIWTNTKENN